jgi:threonine dehydrogenase-like Zn-dependent dehydrogenase
MRALQSEDSKTRLVATKLLSLLSPRAYLGPTSSMRMREIPGPVLPAPDWAVARTRLCGICGSDTKQVFLNGRANNPMTGLISWPQVLGHEVVGELDEVGAEVGGRRVGERVVLNPWLSCVTRGLPPCEWCRRGDLAQCLNFTRGVAQPGIHNGNSATATGGYAPRVPAHASQWIPIPDHVSDDAAVLADPFSVSLHAILRVPPPAGGSVLVYGCGTLGLMAIAILRLLHPDVRVLAIARYPHQARLAEEFGAQRVVGHRPTRRILEAVAEWTGAEALEAWLGLPMLNGGADAVYDTVAAAETFEVGVRAVRSRGSVVAIGLEPPRRFEWTPLYFKEIALVGSNGFGVEAYDGRRQHAMEWYFEFIRTRALDVTPLITHRYALEAYRQAFLSCYRQGESGAVKVLFDRFEAEAGNIT